MNKNLIYLLTYFLIVIGSTSYADTISYNRHRSNKIFRACKSSNLADSIFEVSTINYGDPAVDMVNKLDACYALGMLKYNQQKWEFAIKYWKEGIELSEAARDSSYLSMFHMRSATVEYITGKTLKAQERFKKSMDIAKSCGDNACYIIALNGFALASTHLSEFEKSVQYFKEGISICQQAQDEYMEWTLTYGLVEVYTYQYNYSSGVENGLELLSLSEKLNDTLLMAKSNMAMGIMHMVNDDQGDAIKYFEVANERFKALGNKYWTALTYSNLCSTYRDEKELEKSISTGRESYKMFSEMGIVPQTISVCNMLSHSFYLKKDYDSTFYYSNIALELTDLDNPDSESRSTHLNLARVYASTNRHRKAIEYASKGMVLPVGNDSLEVKKSLCTILSESHKALGNFKEALKYSDIKYEASRQMRDIEEAKKVATILANHENEQEKIKLLTNQAEENAERDKELIRQTYTRNIVIGCLIGVFIICVYLFKQYSSKRKANKVLVESNETNTLQAKKLEEMDKLKSRFFTNISHEFRTPLTLIKGPVEQLQRKLEGDDAEKVKSISKNTKRLLKLVNQILELAELESSTHVLTLNKVKVSPFMQQIAASFEALAKSRNINFVCQTRAVDPAVYLEQESIEKIVINLLSNAFKYSDDNSTISLNAFSVDQQLKIVVKDNGKGISKEEQEHIFDMFYYTESDLSASSGIGLSLVHALVTSHGGRIEVESEIGKGTTFTIILPTKTEILDELSIPYKIVEQGVTDYNTEDQIAVKQPVQKNQSSSSSHNESILVVDDNHEIRNYIYNLLGDRFTILSAKNGIEGIEKAKEFIPDLILCDVMMPEMNGFDLVKILKHDEKTSHIPIVMLTAKGDRDSKIEGLTLKADDYITKPFDQIELIVRIDNLIENRKLMQEKLSKEIMYVSQPAEMSTQSTDQVLLENIMKVIEDRIDDTSLSVDELAKTIGLSRSQLHRKIVGLTGKSTSVFIRNIRLRMAHELLKSQSGNISEIAYNVGFSSPSYFNRCFKEMYGVPPSVIINKDTEEKA